MIEYDSEPVPGLPERLPQGETMIWQGAPQWRAMFFSAWHVRLVLVYFLAMVIIALTNGHYLNALMVAGAGAVLLGLCALFAWAVARSTLYTLTDKRLVLRIGIALSRCVNLPLASLAKADLADLGEGKGTIVLKLNTRSPLGYLMLWPHARPFRMIRPQPQLRAIADAQNVAKLLLNATAKVQKIVPGDTAAAPSRGGNVGTPALAKGLAA